MNARILFAAVVVLASAPLLTAADPAKAPNMKELMMQYMTKYGPPGPEHKFLEPLVGTWTAKTKMWMDANDPPIESDGILTRRAILGGRFVQEDYSGNMMGQQFQGIGTMGYDRAKGKYVATWIDNMNTAIMDSKGKYDESAKSFTFKSNETCPITNQPVEMRDIVQIISPDEQKMTMYRKMGDSPEMKCMEITLTRKK